MAQLYYVEPSAITRTRLLEIARLMVTKVPEADVEEDLIVDFRFQRNHQRRFDGISALEKELPELPFTRIHTITLSVLQEDTKALQVVFDRFTSFLVYPDHYERDEYQDVIDLMHEMDHPKLFLLRSKAPTTGIVIGTAITPFPVMFLTGSMAATAFMTLGMAALLFALWSRFLLTTFIYFDAQGEPGDPVKAMPPVDQ